MFLAYVDESGDDGPIAGGGTKTFTLAVVLVSATGWPGAFDDMIDFRRDLKRFYGVPVRAEIKWNYLLRGSGPFRPLKLGEPARRRIFRMHMRLHEPLGLSTFAVVVRKSELEALHPSRNPREVAWERALQRIERFTTKGGVPLLLQHDDGATIDIRKYGRKARRAGTAGSMFGTGLLRRPASLLIDDPIPRDSKLSYFIQLADLAAYAAYRRLYPPPATIRVPLVPADTWDLLGSAILSAVNMYSGGSPGIVEAP